MTLVYAVYDPETGVFTYANGGHCDPLVVRGDGSTSELPGTRGVVLGLEGDLEYALAKGTIHPRHVGRGRSVPPRHVQLPSAHAPSPSEGNHFSLSSTRRRTLVSICLGALRTYRSAFSRFVPESD